MLDTVSLPHTCAAVQSMCMRVCACACACACVYRVYARARETEHERVHVVSNTEIES